MKPPTDYIPSKFPTPGANTTDYFRMAPNPLLCPNRLRDLAGGSSQVADLQNSPLGRPEMDRFSKP